LVDAPLAEDSSPRDELLAQAEGYGVLKPRHGGVDDGGVVARVFGGSSRENGEWNGLIGLLARRRSATKIGAVMQSLAVHDALAVTGL